MAGTGKAELQAQLAKLQRSLAREKAKAARHAKALAEALQRQTATAGILKVISRSPTDAQPVFDAIADNAMRLLGALSATVTHRIGEALHLAAFTSTSRSGDDALKKAFPFSISDDRDRVLVEAVRSGAPAQFSDSEDAHAPPVLREMARHRGYRSILAVPMMSKGAGIGTVSVTRREAGKFSDHDVGLLTTFADQAVIAIENVRLFNETKEALERQTATAQVLASISGSMTDTQPVFERIVQHVRRLFGTRFAVLQLLHDGVVDMVAVDGDPGFEKLRDRYPRPLDETTVGGRAMLSKQALQLAPVLDNPAAPPATVQFARDFGFNSVIFSPMILDGKVIGAIGAAHPGARPFDDRQIALIKTFADQAVIAIENTRLFKELEARNRDLSETLEQQTATAEILRAISSSPTDERPVFEAIVRSARRLCAATYSVVFLAEDGKLVLAAVEGVDAAGVAALHGAYPRPIGRDTTSGRSIVDRKIVHIEDSWLDPDYTHPLRDTIALRSILSIPMFREGTPIGSVTVWRGEVKPFTDKQIALLQTFADQAVIAIENVRLFKELQQRTDALTKSVGQLTALGEVSQAISSTLDVEKVLQTIVERAVQLTGLDSGAIYEYDEDRQVFHQRGARNVPAELVELFRREPLRLGEGAVGTAGMTRQPVQVPDIVELSYQSRVRNLLVEAGWRALLVVPLLSEGRLLGALSVSRNTPGEFAPEVIELLETFATQSAIAIQNARLFREIEEKGRQLEVASQHKSQFLASMSHELRTPLNAILGFNEMILEGMYGDVPADMTEPLGDIQTSGKHLLRLINNVLDLAKIEAGRMELALADYAVQDLVESVRATLRPLAEAKGLELLASVPQDLPLAHGDPGRLTQCLMNLAGNSLKFTNAGRVAVSVEHNGGTLVYRVADTGIGIPPDKIGSLFTEFRQTDATIASEYGGTGLGLSITRKFVEMHGGRIWVESEPGKGSVFIFELPLRVDDGAAA